MKLSSLRRCAAFAAAAFAGVAFAVPVVVEPVNPTWEVVVADDVMSPVAAGTDAAPEIQRRMDALARTDGGTLFLRAGVYRIATPLVVPPNVTVKGDYSPDSARASTLLSIVCGKGREEGPAAVQLNAAAGLQGLYFHYPEQNLSAPTPYPWTVMNALKPAVIPEHQTVRDCTFVNSWRAIAIGPHWNELHTFRDVRITALKTGFFVDTTSDTGRTEDVSVSPRFWCESGLAGAPAEKDLRAWLLAHPTVGAHIGRSDWENIWRLKVDGYRTGLLVTKGARGKSNAVMAESAFTSCGTGLDVEDMNEVGLAVYDTRFDCREQPVRTGTNFASVIQLLACDLGGKAPVNRGSGWSRVVVKDGEGEPVRHVPMTWPRPASKRLFVVTDYGASTSNADNAAAFEKAFAAAKGAGGGTVYVPGGRYDFRRGVVVPGGVELRGNCATPHHTVSGGTTLMVRYGKGDENGEPLVRLEPKAGVRGLSVWYPENPIADPVPYPWAVQSLGEGCWLVDVNVANAWQAVDFMTHPSAGHRVSYLSGNAWRRGLFVGNSAGSGWVENTQLNPHYAGRLPKDLPRVAGTPRKGFPKANAPGESCSSWLMRERLEAHVFRNCADEDVFSLLVYAAMDGVTFAGRNKARIVIHGTDTAAHGMEIEQDAGSTLSAALCQLTPYATLSGRESAGFHFAKGDRGESSFRACQLWVNKPTLIGEGQGTARFEMAHTLSGAAELRSGRFDFRDFRFAQELDRCFVVSSAAQAKFADSGCYDYSCLTNPVAPPVDLVVDFRRVKPSENVVGVYGSIREADAWLTRIEGDAYRFRADLRDKPHCNVYAEFLKDIRVPVHRKTKLKYRIKPLSASVMNAHKIAFDLHFTDGSLMRLAQKTSWPNLDLKPGEWNEISVSLLGSVGKTIDYMMLRVDVRNVPGTTYEALFDRVRFETVDPDRTVETSVKDIALRGYVGRRLDDCFRNNVAATDVRYLTDWFKWRQETGFWHTEFWGKWMHAAVPLAEYRGDEDLKKKIDAGVAAVIATQGPDGYIGNYLESKRKGAGWDVWGCKYTLMGLMHHYDATKSLKTLEAAKKLADHLLSQFATGAKPLHLVGAYRGLPSCSILEPMVWLYRRTGERRYLDFAAYVVKEMNAPASDDGAELIDAALRGVSMFARPTCKPGEDESVKGGHKAYEMMSCYQGLVDYFEVTGDRRCLDAAVASAADIARTEVNVAGGSCTMEHWYDGARNQAKPYRRMQETCVLTTWMRLCQKLLAVTGESRWADEIEKTFFNAYLASLSKDGSTFSMYHPLAGTRHAGEPHCRTLTNCCNANGPRGFLCFLESYLVAKGDCVSMNQYAPSTASVTLPASGERVTFETYTEYPRENEVYIRNRTTRPMEFTLRVRIPRWSADTKVSVTGVDSGVWSDRPDQKLAAAKPGEYLEIRRLWQPGDKVRILFDFTVRHHLCDGHVAFTRGPLALARDMRFRDGDIGESLRHPFPPAAGLPEFRDLDSDSADLWLVLETVLPLGMHFQAPEFHPRGLPVRFCDYASAGNTWTSKSAYRVWLPVECVPDWFK